MMMMDYDNDYDNDADEDDLIAAAGATSSRPLKVLPGPRKCSPQLHDLSHLVIISVMTKNTGVDSRFPSWLASPGLAICVSTITRISLVHHHKHEHHHYHQHKQHQNRSHISTTTRLITNITCSSLLDPSHHQKHLESPLKQHRYLLLSLRPAFEPQENVQNMTIYPRKDITCSSLSGPPLGPGSFEPRSLIAAPDLPPRLMP